MIVKNFILLGIQIYRYSISPFLGHSCRFYPTCSAYAYEAVSQYGPGKGLWLAVRRLLRCQPFHPGGVDPVPPRSTAPNRSGEMFKSRDSAR